MKKIAVGMITAVVCILVVVFIFWVVGAGARNRTAEKQKAQDEALITSQRQKIIESNERQKKYCEQIKNSPVADVEGAKLCQKLGLSE